MNEHTLIRWVAGTAPWIAPIPSGYFVGRSVYRYLLVGDPWFLAYPVAVVAGLVIEILALATVHTLLDLGRWNRLPNVNKDKGGWERAQTWPMWAAAGVYLGTVVALLVVLEVSPDLSRFAPVLFPGIAVAGAVTLGVIGQHNDRKERYGVSEDLKVHRKPVERVPEPKRKPEQLAPVWGFSKKDHILALVERDPGLTPRGIQEQTGYSLSYVYEVLNNGGGKDGL